MKKMIAFILAVICTLSFAGCSKNDDETKVQFETNNTTASTEPTNTTITSSATEASTTVDSDEAIKAAMIEKYGIPVRIRRTEGMALWKFTLAETTAERAYLHSFEGEIYHKSLYWEIENGDLVITGDWNETFILHIEDNQAISKTNGIVYDILKNN